MKPEESVNILAVDDSPPKLLAYAALLSDHNQNVVTATSGRDALRFLLHQEFAVILLDVNMPGMDGFETAALIRQRKSSEHTPIIFVTSYGDETHAAHGYSLGAVDYILAPVQPEVLRTKVAVFVELYRKTAQIRLQARALEGRALRLQKLTEASLAINSARSIEGVLRAACESARDVLEAHQAVAASARELGVTSAPTVCLSAEASGQGEREVVRDPERLLERLLKTARSLRLSATPQASEAAWDGVLLRPRPPGSWLVVPLATGEGRGLGLLHVLQKRDGDFTEEDESVLTQLAQMSSIAIENIRNVEAQEANRMKDEFLATLSHELRTPLSAILGWTRTLREGTLDSERAAHGLQVIERNVLAQTRLIDDLLDVSRIVTGKLRLSARRMRVASVIESAIEAVRPAAEAREIPIRFDNRAGPDGGEMNGDPDRLQQVVWNLLSNAIKFTPPRGPVDVTLAASGKGFEVSVSDTGRGIPPEFLVRIFDRFRQADSSTTRTQGGLGIGLAIARHLVELHGGTISAASDGPNRGSTFRVNLPARALAVSQELPIPSDLLAAVERRADLTGVRVLVVEDEPDGRELLAQTFQDCGAEVESVPSAPAALALFETFRPHVLVSDIGLPGEDGFSLLAKVRQRSAESGGRVPAVAVTAYVREGDRQLAYDAGFQAHVAKPFEPLVLAALVERLARAQAEEDRVAAAREPDAAVPPHPPGGRTGTANSFRVLVVEDDGDCREGLRQLLEVWGHPVEVAEDGFIGIEKAIQRPPDVALIDIGLPDVDGYQVARRLKEALPGRDLFLVALTGYVEPGDRRRAIDSGFDAHIGKPIDPNKLSTLLASRRPH